MPQKGARMKKIVATTILLLTNFVLSGQTFDTEFYPHDEWAAAAAIETDDHIFYSPAWGAADPFRDLSRYRFGAVRYRERGLDNRYRKVFLGNADLSDNISSYPDYTLISLIRKTGLSRSYTPAMVAGSTPAGIGYSDFYSLKAVTTDELYVSARAADRYTRAGIDIRQNHAWKNGWSNSLTAAGQYGNDGHIKGVYSDEIGAALSLTKEWRRGANLTLFAAGNISERGLRTAATRETFELTGDNLYNPTWGWQEGGVRNSRRRNVRQLFTAVSFETPIGNVRKLTAGGAFRRSHNGHTRLAWYGTSYSPMPDYYRKMPSYCPDWSAKKVIADAWRSEDPTVTQVDWLSLYYNNTLSGDGQATYIVEEQVELSSDAHFNISIDRKFTNDLDATYGIRMRRDRSRFFKLADDMLGAEYVPNTDQYVSGDEDAYYTGPRNENDLRNPGRKIHEGDRFGYDYALTRWTPSVFGIVRWNRPGYGVTASASLTHSTIQRNGYYEKELFPGSASFGKSGAAKFTTYSLGVSAYWNVSVKHRLSLSALASTEGPYADDVFISPEQNNLMVASPVPAGIYGAELSWAFAGKNVDLRVTGFVNASTNQTQVRQYYDDLSYTFCNMVVRDIDKLNYGIEAGAEIRFVRWLSLTVGGSVGEYRYNSEPTAAVFADADNSVVSEGIVCYMSGLKTGPPQTVAAATLTYSDRQWRVSLSGEYMGDRHVGINPLYHSSRITGINSAPEIMARFTSQERLPDAFTLGASVSKGFALKHGYLRLAASVRNILSSQIIYSGYEQMRILHLGTGINRTSNPFPSKYIYSYPLTWNVTISYRI